MTSARTAAEHADRTHCVSERNIDGRRTAQARRACQCGQRGRSERSLRGSTADAGNGPMVPAERSMGLLSGKPRPAIGATVLSATDEVEGFTGTDSGCNGSPSPMVMRSISLSHRRIVNLMRDLSGLNDGELEFPTVSAVKVFCDGLFRGDCSVGYPKHKDVRRGDGQAHRIGEAGSWVRAGGIHRQRPGSDCFWNEFGHKGRFPAPPRPFFRTMVARSLRNGRQ